MPQHLLFYMNLTSAIVHVHYGDCYHNKSEEVQVQVQGTTVVAGAAETEYTGERALFPGKYCSRTSHL